MHVSWVRPHTDSWSRDTAAGGPFGTRPRSRPGTAAPSVRASARPNPRNPTGPLRPRPGNARSASPPVRAGDLSLASRGVRDRRVSARRRGGNTTGASDKLPTLRPADRPKPLRNIVWKAAPYQTKATRCERAPVPGRQSPAQDPSKGIRRSRPDKHASRKREFRKWARMSASSGITLEGRGRQRLGCRASRIAAKESRGVGSFVNFLTVMFAVSPIVWPYQASPPSFGTGLRLRPKTNNERLRRLFPDCAESSPVPQGCRPSLCQVH